MFTWIAAVNKAAGNSIENQSAYQTILLLRTSTTGLISSQAATSTGIDTTPFIRPSQMASVTTSFTQATNGSNTFGQCNSTDSSSLSLSMSSTPDRTTSTTAIPPTGIPPLSGFSSTSDEEGIRSRTYQPTTGTNGTSTSRQSLYADFLEAANYNSTTNQTTSYWNNDRGQ